MPVAPDRLLTPGLFMLAALLLLAACSDDDEDARPAATATEGAATATATITTPPTTAPTIEPTPTPTLAAVAVTEIEVGPFTLTDIRFDPPSGELAPRQAVRITAEVVSTFDRELRLYFRPIFGPTTDDGRLHGCPGGDGNQVIAPGSNSYDRRVWPVDVTDFCPFDNVAVEITGFEVRGFDLDDESVAFTAAIPASFTVRPELANLVHIGGQRYRVLSACQALPTVGLVTENLLLEAASLNAAHPLVGFQWWIDQGVTGYHVQRGPGGEVLEGAPDDFDGTSVPDVVISAGAVFAAGDVDRAAPIAILDAHQRPRSACPAVMHILDADADPDSGGGRWTYGVWQACLLPEGERVDLWLTDGGLLRVRTAMGGGSLATFIGFEGVELAPVDGAASIVSLSPEFISGDLLVAPVDDAAPPMQRLRFDVTLSDAPCRTR